MKDGWLGSVVVACVGAAFAALGIFVYLIPIVSDLHRGTVVLRTTTKTAITWSRSYDFRDHPVYFGVKLLTDFSGVISFGGIGVLLLYVAARGAFDPGAGVSLRARSIGAAWAFTCLAAMILHFALLFFPYLLKNGTLS
jgi:hypothetical protein